MTQDTSPGGMVTSKGSTTDGRLHRSEITKTRILDVAERLFSDRPLVSISMREIAAEAEVSLSSANYHFGSKEDLFRTVFLRRARDLNRERADLLRNATQDAANPPDLRALLDALLRPGVRWSFDPGGRGLFIQFLARGMSERGSSIHALLHSDVLHLRRFLPHFMAALPGLSEEDICWRMHFALGALHYTITSLPRLDTLSEGRCDTRSFDETIQRMTDACEAMFRQQMTDNAARSRS